SAAGSRGRRGFNPASAAAGSMLPPDGEVIARSALELHPAARLAPVKLLRNQMIAFWKQSGNDAMQLRDAGSRVDISEGKYVAGWNSNNKPILCIPGQRLIPQLIDQQQTCLEITIQEHGEDVAMRLHSSPISHENEEVVHRRGMQIVSSDAGLCQMPVLNVLE